MAEIQLGLDIDTSTGEAKLRQLAASTGAAMSKALPTGAEASLGSLGTRIGVIAGIISSAMTFALQKIEQAIRGVIALMGDFVRAAMEQESAEKRLEVATGGVSAALLAQASALQRTTAYDDAAIISAQAAISMFAKNTEQTKALTAATVDFAAAKRIDLASAADIVAKSFGSEVSMLGRYGIAVDGAIGSTERLDNIVRGISARFGGQAAAAAQTFEGRMMQLRSAAGELAESLGNLIVKNTFVISAIGLLRDKFFDLAAWVDRNRLAIMEYMKSGLLVMVKGIGLAIDVIYYFVQGWNALKLAVNAAALALAQVGEKAYDAIRFLLLPLDLLYQGLVKIGAVEVNPFDTAARAIEAYKNNALSTGATVLDNMSAAKSAHAAVKDVIDDTVKSLDKMKVAVASIPKPEHPGWRQTTEQAKSAEASIRALVFQYEAMGASTRRQNELKVAEFALGEVTVEQVERYSAALDAAAEKEGRLAAEKKLRDIISVEPPAAIKADESSAMNEIGKMQANLEVIQNYHTAKIQALIDVNAAEMEITSAHNQAMIATEAQTAQIRIASANVVANAQISAANMVVNLLQIMGSKNRAAALAALVLQKGLAIAQVYIDTKVAAAAALKLGPIAGPPLAASILAWGQVQMALIAATGLAQAAMGGGGGVNIGGGGGGGGGGSALPAPTRTEEKPTQNVTVIIQNGMGDAAYWQKLTEDNIVPAINNAISRNINLVVRTA